MTPNKSLGVLTLMNKEQASWLIVRAFGVYLLIQAFILGLGILGEVYSISLYPGDNRSRILSSPTATASVTISCGGATQHRWVLYDLDE